MKKFMFVVIMLGIALYACVKPQEEVEPEFIYYIEDLLAKELAVEEENIEEKFVDDSYLEELSFNTQLNDW